MSRLRRAPPFLSPRDLFLSSVRKGGLESECPGGSRSSSISDNNERWTLGSEPRSFLTNTRVDRVRCHFGDPREMVNIAVASRHKARTSTANFYFDRRAINMPLRLVRRQITIYRWLLPRLVPSLLHISFNISFPVSFAHACFRRTCRCRSSLIARPGMRRFVLSKKYWLHYSSFHSFLCLSVVLDSAP